MRAVEPERFGAFAQAMWLYGLVGIFDLAHSPALIAYGGDDDRYPRAHFTIQGALSVFGIIVICTVVACGGGSEDLPRLLPIVIYMVLIYWLTSTGLVMCEKAFRFGLMSVASLSSVIVWVLTLVIGLSSGYDPSTVVLLAAALEMTTRGLIAFFPVGWRYTRPVWGKDIHAYFINKFAKIRGPGLWLQGVGNNLDVYLLTKLSTTYQLGIYDRLTNFVRIPSSLSINLVDRVAVVSYSAEQSDPEQVQRSFKQFLKVVVILAGGAVVVSTIGMPFVLRVAVGEQWQKEIMALWYLAIPMMLFAPVMVKASLLLEGIGRVKRLLLGSAVTVGTKAVTALALVPFYGARGMVGALSITAIVGSIYYVWAAVSCLKMLRREAHERAESESN